MTVCDLCDSEVSTLFNVHGQEGKWCSDCYERHTRKDDPTLLDIFAMAALIGNRANPGYEWDYDLHATQAYAQAAAMLRRCVVVKG